MKNWKNNFNKGVLKMSEPTAPAPTELEKLQQEYNNTAFQLGNLLYKRELMVREESELKLKMEKLSVEAAELMKKQAEPKDETAEQMAAAV